jgi:hypothetical protein
MATNADAEFNKQNTDTDDIPQGGDTVDNSYASRPDQKQVPVVKDESPVEQPNDARDPDSNEALGKHIRHSGSTFFNINSRARRG